ncbi:MAG: hypothetical protein ACQEQD_08985 [Bacillota bacterium]
MRKLLVLSLALVFVMTFGLGVMADNGTEPMAKTGDDPMADVGDGWNINEGSLTGWTDSNFTILGDSTTGTSTVVGEGITVDGILVNWEYPDGEGNGAGKGDPSEIQDFDQEINYTIKAFANIPCYLEMNVFGNGAYVNATNIGQGNTTNAGSNNHWLLFDTSYGGVVDANWDFVAAGDIDPSDIAEGTGERYIQGCDVFSANLFANVPYQFKVYSDGLTKGNATLPIEMRTTPDDTMSAWSADNYLLSEGNSIGSFDAMEEAHINMQFRVPFNAVEAGYYEGDVVFTMSSM